jgi:DNA-binding NarL/FixJ family response regulator
VAERLHISPVTVRRHVSNSLQKLDEQDRRSVRGLSAGRSR